MEFAHFMKFFIFYVPLLEVRMISYIVGVFFITIQKSLESLEKNSV